ncbi:hypothetical protein ACQ86N_26325 [Puia sp. P3]|uniref:hypothetical protein n=1 Tax=Puia sp. P3 TaxID=3423952 RepID=UPI003D66FB9E
MMRIKIVSLFVCLLWGISVMAQQDVKVDIIALGVVRLTVGTPDRYSPYSFCREKPRLEEMRALSNAPLPFDVRSIRFVRNSRGVQVRVPLGDDEQLYGFGMQVGSFEQRGLRKRPIVNDRPVSDIGYTHAPEPFYVSTAGYGVLVNSSRYISFLCGSNQELNLRDTAAGRGEGMKFTTEELYANRAQSKAAVWIDIPGAEGVEIFLFQGRRCGRVCSGTICSPGVACFRRTGAWG